MEIEIIKFLQASANSFYDFIFITISYMASVWGFLLISVFGIGYVIYGLVKKNRTTLYKTNTLYIFTFLITYGVGVAVNTILKNLIDRPRPYIADLAIIDKLHAVGQSMPSGHMLSATILTIFILYALIKLTKKQSTKIIYVCLGVVFLSFVAISRMYLGQHYITDLIVGFCLAFIISFLLIYIYNKIKIIINKKTYKK